MSHGALVSIICEDRVGLIAAVTGRLYELGVNLGDTTFAVLGGGAEFTTVAEIPSHHSLGLIEQELAAIPMLKGAKISVAPLSFRAEHGDSARITHRIEIAGEDSPGLIARLSETFVGFGANIVRLNSERVPGGRGYRYVTRIAVWIAPEKSKACLATVANTAEELRLTCKIVEAA
jgi:glycine cleavage system transcriptional repressor